MDDQDFLLILFKLSEVIYEIYKENPERLMNYVKENLDVVSKHVKKCGLDISESVDNIIEHDLWKLKMFLENPIKLINILLRYSEDYSNEFLKYGVAYIGSNLLIYAIPKSSEDCETLNKIVDILSRYSEDLELYLATFIELIDEKDEDYVVRSCGNEECMKNLLI